MKGVAQGLQTLHGANIVHGSLHGNNVFAVNRKQGIVGDFDFTKSEVKQTKPKLVVLFFFSWLCIKNEVHLQFVCKIH